MRLCLSTALAIVLPLCGCASVPPGDTPRSAMLVDARQQVDTRERVVDGNRMPLRFVKHKFDVHCYDTLTFYVEYNGQGFLASEYRAARSPSYAESIPRERWPLAGYIGVRNWPVPATLRWTSLDGTEHRAEIDFSHIFADALTLHQVPDEELVPGMLPQGISTDPEIHLEVNNRTVRVFQRASLYTRSEQVPGNSYSRNRSDLLLVAEYHY